MRAIDTNVLVRLITRDNSKQVASAEKFVESGAWVSVLVLAEAIWMLSAVYNLRATQIGSAVEMLLNHKDITLQEPAVVTAALEMFRRRPTVGFADCLVLEL